jgi:hypothetical protein
MCATAGRSIVPEAPTISTAHQSAIVGTDRLAMTVSVAAYSSEPASCVPLGEERRAGGR